MRSEIFQVTAAFSGGYTKSRHYFTKRAARHRMDVWVRGSCDNACDWSLTGEGIRCSLCVDGPAVAVTILHGTITGQGVIASVGTLPESRNPEEVERWLRS